MGIIKKGDEGNDMFLVEAGGAYAMVGGMRIKDYKVSDYFGELALLKRQPRAADVIAASTPTKVLCVDGDSFRRLLGNLAELMTERAKDYAKVAASPKTPAFGDSADHTQAGYPLALSSPPSGTEVPRKQLGVRIDRAHNL